MKLSEHFQISKRAIRHLFSLSRSFALCLMLEAFLQSLLPYMPIYFSALLIDALYEGRPVGTLALYVSLTVGLAFLPGLACTYLTSRREISEGEMYRNSRWVYSEKALQMAYASIEDSDVSLLRSRIAMESQTGYNLWYLNTCTVNLISSLTKIVLSLSLTLSFFLLRAVPVWLRLGLSGSIFLAVLCGVLTARKTESMTNRVYEHAVFLNLLGEKFHPYVQHYSSGKDIRLYDMADGLHALITDALLRFQAFFLKLTLKIAALRILDILMNHALYFWVYLTLLCAALSGQITVGSIARYASCVMLLLSASSGLVSTLQRSALNHEHLKRYFSYFDIENPMYQGSLTVEKRDDNEYLVEFRNVSFRYPHTEAFALRHVNLKFKVGGKLALVGRNGSGKTTFIKLLCRLYDPTEGEILLNGVNIKKYDYDEYMSIFSVVFQDFRLFGFRLGENVASASSYDPEKARKCLVQASFGERLDALPQGTESFLYKEFDADGIEISGGEGQKIALARALYKDAPFLILDEPTSALDPVSEYEVYSRFSEIAGDKTAIYISHRLASCRFCDRIAVFDGGEIVQTGSHEALLAEAGGLYRELWDAQARHYTRQAPSGAGESLSPQKI